MFGKSSEALDPHQLHLLLEGVGPNPVPKTDPCAQVVPAPRRKKNKRPELTPRIPEHLPVIEEIVDPLEVQANPEAWRLIGEEVTEQIDYDPAKLYRRRIIRRKYVKKDDAFLPLVIAPLPPRIIEGGIGSPSLLAFIISSKVCYHLPLYRLETMFKTQHGLNLPRQTMARWVGIGAHWLSLIYKEICSHVLSGNYFELDETPIPYLSPGHGRTKLGYFWVACRPRDDTAYFWFPSRGPNVLKKLYLKILPELSNVMAMRLIQALLQSEE